MRQFAMFIGAVVLVAAGRMVAPPAEPEHPRVEPEPVPVAAIPPPTPSPAMPGMPGGQQPTAPAQGG